MIPEELDRPSELLPKQNADRIEEATPGKKPQEKHFNIAVYQEKTRGWLAKALVIIFGSTISAFFLFMLIAIIFPTAVNAEELKDLLTLILTSEVGIIGTTLGFYFGNQSKS